MQKGLISKNSPQLQSTFLKQAIPTEVAHNPAQKSSPMISAEAEPIQLSDIMAQFNEMLNSINGETLDDVAPKMEFSVHALNEQLSLEQLAEFFREIPELRDTRTKKISLGAVLSRLCAHALDNSNDTQLMLLKNSYCFHDPMMGKKRITRQRATLEILLKTPDRKTAFCRQEMAGQNEPEIDVTLVEVIE
jgi:hypothetical protein